MKTKGYDINRATRACTSGKALEAAIKQGAPYPLDQCVSDQQDKGYSEDEANKICGSLKAGNAAFTNTNDNNPNRLETAATSPTNTTTDMTPTMLQEQDDLGNAVTDSQFGDYADFEDCLDDQINNVGIDPESAVTKCATMLQQNIRANGYINQGDSGFGVASTATASVPASVIANLKSKGKSDSEIREAFSSWEHCQEVMLKEYDQDTANQVCGYFKSIGEAKTKKANTNNNNNNSNLTSAGAVVDRFSPDNQKYFIKTFLLNAAVNVNQWGVSNESLPQLIQTFVGKPLVLTEDFGHPNIDEKSLQHALQYQETFRIGNISEIAYNDREKTYYAIVEVTDPRAKAAFAAGDLPLYVSPAIAKLDPSENDAQINKWLGVHLALVDDPAYTVKKAIISGQCSGSSQQCLMQLRKAHVERFGIGGCGFCVKKVLLAKVSEVYEDRHGGKQLLVPLDGNESELEVIAKTVRASNETEPSIIGQEKENTNNSLSDFSASNQQEDILVETKNSNANASTVAAIAPPSGNTSNTNTSTPQQQKPIATDNGIFTAADYEKLKAKCEAQEGIIMDQQSTIEKISGQLKTIDEQYKKAEFEKIITADIIENDDERRNKIAYFISKDMTPDDVRDIYKNVIEAKERFAASLPQQAEAYPPSSTTRAAKAYNAPDGVYHTQQPSHQAGYDAKVPYRTATVMPSATSTTATTDANDNDQDPPWIRFRNLSVVPSSSSSSSANESNSGGVA